MKSVRLTRIATMTVAMLALAAPAYAAGSGMPWEGPLEQIVDSITGPVARAAAVIAIVIAGVTIIFSEGGGGVRKLAFVGLGIAIMHDDHLRRANDNRLTNLPGKPVDSPYSYWFVCKPTALEERPVRIFHDWLVQAGL